jgi:ankyrin repeat protein
MIGTDKIRFCEHCNLQVNNLSAMTRAQMMRLISRSSGRLCVRYVEPAAPAMKPQEKLHRIGRRVTRLAAGAFTATLSLAAAAAQGPAPSDSAAITRLGRIAESNASNKKLGSLTGVITDPVGAVVPGVLVTLANSTGDVNQTMFTNDAGEYSFSALGPGTYTLKAEGAGFAPQEISEDLSLNESRAHNLTLQPPLIVAQVEVLALPTENVMNGGAMIVLPEEPLIKAIASDEVALAKQLMFTTADINKLDEHTNMTAMHHAVENGSYEIVRALLSAGASVRTKTSTKRTPLMFLRESATVELVRELLSAGSKVNERDERHETALMNAAEVAKVDVVRLLVEAGANLSAVDEDGKTVLMFGAGNNDPEVVKYLLALGADVNARNNDQETALIIASQDGPASVVKVLIDAGADVNAIDSYGYTPLINGVGAQNLEMVKLLLDSGADLSVKSKDGETLLTLARKFGVLEVEALLKSRGAVE